MSWTLCTSGAAIFKAGENADSSATLSGSMLAKWSDEVEGKIDFETNTAWVANHAGLSTAAKNILSDVCSSLIAMNIISYNSTGYLNREADILLNVNDDRANKGLKVLTGKADTLKTP